MFIPAISSCFRSSRRCTKVYCTATPTTKSFLLAGELHILVFFIEEDGRPTAILLVKQAKDVDTCDLEGGHSMQGGVI